MQTPGNDSLVGSVVDDRYLVESRIARGGMSTVYLAMDQRLERHVALKVLYPHLAADSGFLARFEREAKSAARLSHPHVVGVLDQGTDGSLAYLVMEYVPGRTLRDLLAERTRLTPRQALAFMDAVVDGLAAAHDAGLVHRDVKPENVLLADNGQIKIADFGLARAVSTTTNTGTLVGTVAYLAPELVTGGGSDERSDVYSAGIMLYEMLTGAQPFTGQVPIQVAFQHVHSTVPAPSEACPGLAEDLDELVQWCTAPDPEDRPVDGRALLGELRHIRTSLSDQDLDYSHPDSQAAGGRPDGHPTGTNEADGGSAGSGASGATEVLGGPAGGGSGATEVFPAGRFPAGATEVLSAAPPPGGREPFATEVLQRTDNATTVLSAAAPGTAPRTRQNDDGEGNHPRADGASDADGPQTLHGGRTAGTSWSERRQALRDFKAFQRRSDRDAHRPQVSLRRGRPRRRGLLLTLLLVLLLAAATFAGWFFGAGPGALVGVPAVASTRADDAGRILGDHGLRYTTSEVYDEVIAAGFAVGTDPAALEEIRKFQPVTLLVSKGPELFTVPNVIQRTTDAAAEDLADAGLVLGTVTEAYSPSVPAGSVISQLPAVDAQLRQGTPVDVVVSIGPEPVEVPSVIGQSEKEATKVLEDAGFTVETAADKVYSRDVASGSVAGQSPASGLAEAGSTVTLTISQGPRMVEVPNLTGRQVDEARRELEELGFQVQVNEILGGFFGTVRAQDPSGKSAPEGSLVTLTVV